MFDLPMHFVPGKLVVFEGMDNTGKSTQLEMFEAACYRPTDKALYEPLPIFTHQPSGTSSKLGLEIYELTEATDWRVNSPLSRQLLHLAAHAEHYATDILPALKERAVMMDRCWWSTVAYGYRGVVAGQFRFDDFIKLAQAPAQGKIPDLVFYFEHQYG